MWIFVYKSAAKIKLAFKSVFCLFVYVIKSYMCFLRKRHMLFKSLESFKITSRIRIIILIRNCYTHNVHKCIQVAEKFKSSS